MGKHSQHQGRSLRSQAGVMGAGEGWWIMSEPGGHFQMASFTSKEIKDEGSPGDKSNGAWTELDRDKPNGVGVQLMGAFAY